LGGGVVPGSLILVSGDPGIGKSTLLLQLAALIAEAAPPALYVSGEESSHQIKMRANRLGIEAAELYLLAETELESILEHVHRLGPRLVVVDSIQAIHTAGIESTAGSISQVRACAAQLQEAAKSGGTSVVLVGHVTKEGAIAGPRVLEHMVDTVLYLEGDRFHSYRLLRAIKNRYGATSEVGVFEMGSQGMKEVTMEGTRPLLVEVQALTSPTSFANPRRTGNGVDFNRLLLLTAVLSKRVGIRLHDQDVFANIIGGLQVREPAADLAVAVAIASSRKDRPVAADIALMGEVGLSGELRAVRQLEARLREAAKLGFRRCIVPAAPGRPTPSPPPSGPQEIEIHAARSLRQAIDLALLE
jgi:DNA repair protein RadA/Sms